MKNMKLFFFLFLIPLYLEASPDRRAEKHIPHVREEVVLSYAAVVKKVAPAVVNIYTMQHMRAEFPHSPFQEDHFFKQFFEHLHPEQERNQFALGSGVIVDKLGFILTNYHVVQNADVIQVVLHDKREFVARLVTKDKRSDLALLKIDAKDDLPYLSVSPQEDLEVGDVVLAIGNPFGVGQTVTHGIVSALARSQKGISDFRSFIQTDAAVNPGNSGGALVTTDGRLVGINTAIYSKSGGSMGISFAIPTTLAIPIIESTHNGGRIVRPWMGIEVEPTPVNLTEGAAPAGVRIKEVYPQGSAHEAGLQKGDVIAALDGHEIDDQAALDYRVAISPVGKKTTVTVLRQGRQEILPIQLVEPSEAKDAHAFTVKGRHPLLGSKMQILSPALAIDLGLNPMQTGVVITEVEKTGAAIQLGIVPGDILLSINDQAVKTQKDATNLLQNKENSWKLELRRGNKLMQFHVKG